MESTVWAEVEAAAEGATAEVEAAAEKAAAEIEATVVAAVSHLLWDNAGATRSLNYGVRPMRSALFNIVN